MAEVRRFGMDMVRRMAMERAPVDINMIFTDDIIKVFPLALPMDRLVQE